MLKLPKLEQYQKDKASKNELVCLVCNMYLEEPVYYICCNLQIYFCEQHLKDKPLHCASCKKNFDPLEAQTPHMIKKYLEEGLHLEEHVKAMKKIFEDTTREFNSSVQEFYTNNNNYEINTFENIARVKNMIDLHREYLKRQIDINYMDTIKNLEKMEQDAYKNLNADYNKIVTLTNNARNANVEMKKKFQNPTISKKEITSSQFNILSNINSVKDEIKKFNSNVQSINSICFVPTEIFGNLISNEDEVFIVAKELELNVYDLSLRKLITTMNNAHDKKITSIEKLPDNFFLSSSEDSTVKLWQYSNSNLKLINTFHHYDSVLCLKYLRGTVFVSGTCNFIYLWNYNSNEKLQNITITNPMQPSNCFINSLQTIDFKLLDYNNLAIYFKNKNGEHLKIWKFEYTNNNECKIIEDDSLFDNGNLTKFDFIGSIKNGLIRIGTNKKQDKKTHVKTTPTILDVD